VSSFKKYLSKLHPSKIDLWQKPRDSFEEDSFWYCNAALGENTLANTMSEICRIAKSLRNKHWSASPQALPVKFDLHK
jgi:hypothetical protein